MQAICYKCGENKSSPLKMCSHCHGVPNSESDQILSLCLSVECVKPETLARCRKYFKKKQKPPRFKDNIVNLATMLLDEQASNSQNNSLEFSSSLFEFPDLQEEDARAPVETVTAHIIGKGPKQDEDDGSATLGKTGRTYHKQQWIVGRDIPQDQYNTGKDHNGDVYIWYRWINNKWTWTSIGKSQFDQLKSVELGRSFS